MPGYLNTEGDRYFRNDTTETGVDRKDDQLIKLDSTLERMQYINKENSGTETAAVLAVNTLNVNSIDNQMEQPNPQEDELRLIPLVQLTNEV